MNERTQSGNASSGTGLPDAQGNSQGIRYNPIENANLPDAADRARAGRVLASASGETAERLGPDVERDLRSANRALPHEGGQSVVAGYLGFRLEYGCHAITQKIAQDAEKAAEKARREIHAMCVSARRSFGQLTRKDYLAKRVTSGVKP